MNLDQVREYRKSFNEEEMNEITTEYDRGDRVKDIIAKHGLKIAVGQMPTFLPLIATNSKCPYCDNHMKKKRGRTAGYYYDDIELCDVCGHILSRYKRCNCKNCLESKERAKFLKKEKIKVVYSAQIPKQAIEFSSLPFELQSSLFIIYKMKREKEQFESFSLESINSSVISQLLPELFSEGVIYISPDSDVEAFYEEDFPNNPIYSRVLYKVNVSFSEEDLSMLRSGHLARERFNNDEIASYIRKLEVEDLLSYMRSELKERRIDFEPTKKQLIDLRMLLDEFSYSQIKYVCHKVVVFYSDGITTGKIYRSKAPTQVLASVANFAHRAMGRYGVVFSSNAEYVEGLLRIVIESVLEEKITILNTII